jgi:hypothetical protein
MLRAAPGSKLWHSFSVLDLGFVVRVEAIRGGMQHGCEAWYCGTAVRLKFVVAVVRQ